MQHAGPFDDAVDWLLNHGAVDFEMRDRFRAIAAGLVPSDEIDDLDRDQVRDLLIEAGEVAP